MILLRLTVLQSDGSREVCLCNPRYITCVSPTHGGTRWTDYTYKAVPDGARSFVEFIYNRTTVGYFVAESVEEISVMAGPGIVEHLPISPADTSPRTPALKVQIDE